jgi:hypothetical protein
MAANANPKSLVGRFFVIWQDSENYAYTVPNYQGVVDAQLEDGHYLCQYFDAIAGQPSTMEIFHISTMIGNARKHGSFEFFEDDEHMRDWFEHTWNWKREHQ